jgi:hypothetical protein
MKQVLIKKTGEIFDIVSEYSMMKLSLELPIDFPDKENFKKEITETWTHSGLDQVKMKTGKDKEDYYVLSNGETYEVDDLAVGLDEIRDWKLKNNLNI